MERRRVTFLGHATVLIEIGRSRILTDPVLRDVLGFLRRPPVDLGAHLDDPIDAVLISHGHHDHLDGASLKTLPRSTRVIVGRGLGALVTRLGFARVEEVEPGDVIDVDGMPVRVVKALHDGGRPPFGPQAPALGFVVEGEKRVYFAGDTDIFEEMAEFAPTDLALLPIGGWGPRLGAGHLDPARAARAAALLQARVAVPIHWGTLHPIGLRKLMPADLAGLFTRAAAESAPATRVRVLRPGSSLDLGD